MLELLLIGLGSGSLLPLPGVHPLGDTLAGAREAQRLHFTQEFSDIPAPLFIAVVQVRSEGIEDALNTNVTNASRCGISDHVTSGEPAAAPKFACNRSDTVPLGSKFVHTFKHHLTPFLLLFAHSCDRQCTRNDVEGDVTQQRLMLRNPTFECVSKVFEDVPVEGRASPDPLGSPILAAPQAALR
ncbi:hypothetical protein [Deinococcus peraridilitoris]|uniref:hypothetical protein n=1 Tax=Deinococcus peraridilitoris TaxID=432329 RepID=UPI000694853E|nr:hypothetical protein [Deinococcus peraridilitoris]